MQKGEDVIGAGVVSISENVSEFTPITIPVTYINNETPDFAVILIEVSNQQMNSAANGSYAEVNNLSFDVIFDVNDNNLSANEFSLKQNYPNPFNPATIINYNLPEAGLVTLKVYDIIGKEIETLVNKQQAAGKYSVEFNASAPPSVVYIYRLQSGSQVQTRKMTLLK